MDKRSGNVRFERGQGLIEYALTLTLIALTVLIILALLGRVLEGVYHNIAQCLKTPLQCEDILKSWDAPKWVRDFVRNIASGPVIYKILTGLAVAILAYGIFDLSWKVGLIIALKLSGTIGAIWNEVASGLSSVFSQFKSKTTHILKKVWYKIKPRIAAVFKEIARRRLIWSKLASANLELASGNYDAAIEIFEQLGKNEVRSVWKHLTSERLMLRTLKAKDSLPFYQLACKLAGQLAPPEQLVSFT